METGNGVTRNRGGKAVEGVGFERILVAAEHSEAEHAAVFAAQLSGAFDASVQVFELPAVHGMRRSGQDHQLAMAVASEAERSRADLIVLAADRARVGRHHLAGSIRQQLSMRTHLPVMVAPTQETSQSLVVEQVPAASADAMRMVRRTRRFQHV